MMIIIAATVFALSLTALFLLKGRKEDPTQLRAPRPQEVRGNSRDQETVTVLIELPRGAQKAPRVLENDGHHHRGERRAGDLRPRERESDCAHLFFMFRNELGARSL